MVEISVPVKLGKIITTSFSHENDKILRSHHQRCWQSAAEILCERVFIIEDNEVSVRVDWSSVLDHINYLDTLDCKLVDLTNSQTQKDLSENYFKLVNMTPMENVILHFHVRGEDLSALTANCIIEYFLHDLFMIVNIASPASIDLYGATIADDHEGRLYKIGMSNLIFEVALLDYCVRPWLPIRVISVKDVMDWFLDVRIPLTMTPRNRMDRALIALMHIAKSEVSETTVIWIFYALESLFDTKTGENFNSLFNRIKILLSIGDQETFLLKKKLRMLYDLRSAIVHGGCAIIHPIGNEIFDKEMLKTREDLMGSIDFGCHVLISSIQEVARRGIKELSFAEKLKE